jgi:hypothetical protein
MATAGPSVSTAFSPAASTPAKRASKALTTGPKELTGRGGAGRAAIEQSHRRESAAAVAAHRRSRRWGGEHGPRRGARASVDHRGAVCLPGGAGDRVEGAVDGRIDYGRRRRAAARGEQDSGEGMVGAGLARAEEQEEEVGSLLVQGIRVGWHGEGESRRGAAAVVRCCVGEEHRADQSGKRGCGSVGSNASSQKRGRHWEKERITAGLRIAAARWRPACTRGHRGACAGGHRSRGYCGGQRVG